MSDVIAKALVETLPDILPPRKSETVLGTPGHEKAKAVHEAKAKTPLDTL